MIQPTDLKPDQPFTAVRDFVNPPANETEPPSDRKLHRRLLGDLGNTQSHVVAALRAVVELHGPAVHGTWTVCGECAHQAWPLPTDPNAMWSTVVWPCATVREIADALGHPVEG